MTRTRTYKPSSIGGFSDWFDVMRAIHAERLERYGPPFLADKFPVSTIPEGESVILGTFACTFMSSKKRYLKRSGVIDIGFGPQAPGEVARDYLTAKFGRGCTPFRKALPPIRSMPAYAFPGKYDDCAYVDVSAAYWSIMQIVGWPILYNRGEYLSRGGSVADFPGAANKMARNILVICGLPAKLYIQTHWGLKTKKMFTQLLNPDLWNLTRDVLHTLAAYAHNECGAVYFLTDGAIMPDRFVEQYQAFAARLGLTITYKSGVGKAYIRTIGAYKVAEKQTKTYQRAHDNAHFGVGVVNNWLVEQVESWRDSAVWPAQNMRQVLQIS